MTKTFTHETLTRYVFNELRAEDRREVEQALHNDADLAAHCADLQLAQQWLNELPKGPSEQATQNILQYSRTFMRSA